MSNWSPCSRILRPGRLAEPRGGRRTSAVRGRAAARSNAAVIADLLWAHLLPRVEPEPGSGMWDGKLLEAAHRLQGTVEPTHEEPGLSSRDYKPDRDIAPAE